jgi:hypothetical protein
MCVTLSYNPPYRKPLLLVPTLIALDLVNPAVSVDTMIFRLSQTILVFHVHSTVWIILTSPVISIV